MGAALGKGGQALQHILDAVEHMARPRRVVVLRNVLKDLLEIAAEVGLRRVVEVIFGCIIALSVSWLMSRI